MKHGQPGAFGAQISYLERRKRRAQARSIALSRYTAQRQEMMERNKAAQLTRNKWYRRLWRWIRGKK